MTSLWRRPNIVIETSSFILCVDKSRLEESDFLSQWTRRKMKIRLEKPAVNISKFTGGKNEKLRRVALREKLQLDLYFIYSKH